MSDLAWPRWVIDQPLLEGYGMEMLPAVGSMEVEAGPPIQWPDASSDYRVVTVRFFCINEATRLAFDRWYHDTILNGTLPFDVQLKDGRTDNWWTAMMLDVWEAQWGAPGYVWLAAKLLLIGEPFAARETPTFEALADVVFTLRAAGTPTFALQATADVQFQLRATAVDASVALEATADVRFEMQANGALNADVDFEAIADVQLQMRAVLVTSEARHTDDADDRLTDDGDTRVTD
jgi:hypothetical protein